MELEIKCYSALCELEKFKINGIEADHKDFGTKMDTSPALAEPYCCYNMQFIPKLATQEVLDKYKINVEEYNQICKELDCLSFGYCHWCS